MQITFLGIVWIIAIFFTSLMKDVKGLLSITLLSMVLQCNNAIVIGDVSIGIQIFTVSFALVRFIFLPSSQQKRDKAYKDVIAIMVSLIVALAFSLIANLTLESTNLLGLLMIIVYIAFAAVIAKKNINIDSRWLEKTENLVIAFVLCVGALQVLSKYGFSLFDTLLTTFIYNDTLNTDIIFHHKTTAAFYSTFMEPSYCGAFLVAAFAAVIMRRESTRKNIVLSVLLIIAILLTRSSTAYGGLAIIILMALFVRSSKKIYKTIIPFIVVIGFIVVAFNMDVLNEVIFDKIGSAGSYTTRLNWNRYAWEAFLQSPLFGIGYKNIRASSIYVSLLGEIGIVGTLVYTVLILFCVSNALKRNVSDERRSRFLFVCGVIVCQIIACPDLNFSPFWLGLYLLMLAIKCEKNEEASLPTPEIQPTGKPANNGTLKIGGGIK